ncbi:DMT family transporter [Lentilactobacillus raoultii]|uniref:DMT family transporter n=1 Tax=Lentilactobacillus raoultii TaxID=1987503 RepID=A0ABW3PLM9_9LACO|nr:DMT family transporter [Lentilactobacillus raoultii]
MLFIIFGIIVGVTLPFQIATNSKLQQTIASSLQANLVNFIIGSIVLAILALVTGQSLGISLNFVQNVPVWIWLGGVLGVIYQMGNILLFPRLGGVATVLMPILGQIFGSLLIDNFRLFDSPFHAITAFRLLGVVLVLLGILTTVVLPTYLINRQRLIQVKKQRSAGKFSWGLLGILCGGVNACQVAINGALGHALGSPAKASYISLVTGMILLFVIIFFFDRPRINTIKFRLHQYNAWWIWIGGIFGAAFVFGNSVLVPILGTGMTAAIVLIGQLSGSLLIDEFGWVGARRNPINLLQIIGILIMIGGVFVIKLC